MTVHDQWQASLTHFLPILDDHAHLKNLTIRNPTAAPRLSAATCYLMVKRRAAQRLQGWDWELAVYKGWALGRSVYV